MKDMGYVRFVWFVGVFVCVCVLFVFYSYNYLENPKVFPYRVSLGQTGKCQDVCVKSVPKLRNLL